MNPPERHGPPTTSETLLVGALSVVVLALAALHSPGGSEFRYLLAAREMLWSGDWVVPHLGGVPYMEKPILFYWLSAATQAVFGESLLAARAPSVLGATLLLAVTYAFAREHLGRRGAAAAAALLLSASAFLVMGTALTTDPLFSGVLALAWYAAWRVRASEGAAWPWVFWVAAAAALLTKGPLGPVLLVAAAGVFAVTGGGWRWILRLHPVRGVLLFLALTVPWHLLVAGRDPRLLEFFYVRENLHAFQDGRINHEGPVYYYLVAGPAEFFPWTIAVFLAGAAAFRRIARRPRAATDTAAALHLYLVAVLVGPLLVLSAAGSKLGTYVLPLFPVIAVLGAAHLGDLVRRRSRLVRLVVTAPAVILVVGPAVALPRLLHKYDLAAFATATKIGLSIAVAILVGGALWAAVDVWRGRVRRSLCVLGAATFAGVLVATTFAADPGARVDSVAVASAVHDIAGPDDHLVVASRHAQDYEITLVLGRPVQVYGRARELGFGHFVAHTPHDAELPPDPYLVESDDVPDDAWLLSHDGMEAEWKGDRRVWLFGEEKDLVVLRRRGAEIYRVVDDGRTTAYSNHPLTPDQAAQVPSNLAR